MMKVVNGFAGLMINPSKNDYFLGIEAKAAFATARGGVQFTLWGIPIEVVGQVEAIAISRNIGIGIKDGEFYFGVGTAVLFGGSFYIRIKLWWVLE